MNLIDKLRTATEGSRELDAEIALVSDQFERRWNDQDRFGQGGDWMYRRDQNYSWMTGTGDIPEYSTSIDAALTLVPENENWDLSYINGGFNFVIRITRLGQNSHPQTFWAETAPLAICIAALVAREKV